MNILVINTGSSSLKYQLYDMETETVIAKGNCDRIGIDGHLKHAPSNGKPVFNEDIPLPTHAEAISTVIEKLTSADYGVVENLSQINAIGHRVVHGGRKFFKSARIDDDVLHAIMSCVPLAPLHIPANLMGIHACLKAIPGVPQVAVFDTAFHHTIPEHASVYAIPYRFYEEKDILRYGFHGTSHRYVSAKAIEYLGGAGASESSRIVTCHLGNGASLAAIRDGKSVDTTMGVTPLEGLPMGTRCGSIDPSIISIIANLDGGLTMREAVDVLNKSSGVLGISGTSSDFRDIIKAAGIDENNGKELENKEINYRARLALNVYNYQVAKLVGAYIVALGGTDAVIFTAGIGENSPVIRKGICSLLDGFSIFIDDIKNESRGNGEIVDITGAGSKAKVLIIPTNEELVIARDTLEIIGA